jgi:CRISPR-associated protein Cas5h
MKLIIFDWKGKIAHFRKLDTNSSSLTYSFPTRTAITGMIAGVLGFKKDSYYDVFSPDKCKIGLSVRSPVRKLFQTVNYLFVKTKGDLNGINGHTQIPVEFLFPSIGNNYIIYRIYFWHKDEKIYQTLKKFLQSKKAMYPPFMGLSELISSLEFIQETDAQIIEPTNKVKFQSVVRISEVSEHSLEFQGNFRFSKEFMTRFFTKQREIAETDSYLMEEHNQLIGVPKVPYYHLEYEDENILFM